jgi:2-phospho-L-lactate guanylyltransferase (CobY/MobA/RfbA family)
MVKADAAVVLFRGDPRREERQKELPPQFLSTLHQRLLRLLDTIEGADVLTASGVGRQLTIEGAGHRGQWSTSTLADRVDIAVRFCFESGYQRVVLLAGDVALPDRETIARALSALDDPAPRLVLGSSSDGGFYLAGFNRQAEVQWQSILERRSLAASSLAVEGIRAGFAIVMVGVVDDIDARADAERLVRMRRGSRGLLHLLERLASLLFQSQSEDSPSPHATRLLAYAAERLRGPPLALFLRPTT